jgi:hypothetical protein
MKIFLSTLIRFSPSQQDQALHTSLINAFNHLGALAKKGEEEKAVLTLIAASECDEVGMGSSVKRKGKRLGRNKATEVISLFGRIPQYRESGFRHFEEIQLYIDGISKDRISDISCSFLKSFLIDFTIDQCSRLSIPTETSNVKNVYDYRSNVFKDGHYKLPLNPIDQSPVLFVPKRWLRFNPWLNYDDYFENYCPQDAIAHAPQTLERVEVLNYNRENYGVVDAYVLAKERTFEDCHNDPLFSQIPILSARRKFQQIKRLPSGKDENADKQYEDLLGQLLPSLLYPQLDFAQEQARTESGVSIRDLIFYNTRSTEFLKELMDDYGSRQITLEMKNVKSIQREHVDQLNRYLADELGRFGIFVTRNPLKAAEFRRTIDLWSGQRKAVIELHPVLLTPA